VTYGLIEESGTIFDNCFFKVVVQRVFERIDVVRAIMRDRGVALIPNSVESMQSLAHEAVSSTSQIHPSLTAFNSFIIIHSATHSKLRVSSA
jgi:hypothetical protein